MLSNSARRFPARPAVTWGDQRLTYADLDRRSDALAHGLASLGARKDDRVVVLMRNRPELIEAMYACFKAAYCMVPLNSRLTAAEVTFHLGDSQPAAVLTDPEGVSVLAAADRCGAAVVVAGTHGGDRLPVWAHDHEDVIAAGAGRPSAVAEVDRDDLAWLFYTSGTTGRPKGAMLSHGNLGFVTASWLADLTPMTEEDVTLHAAPLSHGAGFHALAATARGAHQVIPASGRFDPSGILELIAAEGVTNTWLVPTQIVMLLDAAGDRPPDLPSLRHVAYGGAPFAPADLRRALEVFGPRFVQLFGQGETPMTATVLSAADHAAALAGDRPQRLSSAGVPRPGTDVRVMNDDVELPVGQVGELCVRGSAVMLGYWQRPEETAGTLRHGWLHTGDLGRMDEHGYLYLLDRAKDLIISGGSNVYAVEVEAVLAGHEAVREVAVVGVTDRTWGETVVAVVVSGEPGPDTEVALAAHCAGVLAGYKCPRRYVFREALPRNAYGKVLKRELREDLAGDPPGAGARREGGAP
ncbi:MAG TPA: long-chain fatty acid--CoA ligase [Acidimicrobiales bacterium]|nr:long-chain fatty acid--CoA ligase [Acidimicrobiales bacterium]